MFQDISRLKKTKVMATLGPASHDLDVLKTMIRQGVDMIRINASHLADYQYLSDSIALIRRCEKELKKPMAICLDLQGPKIRVGLFPDGPVLLKEGQDFVITTSTRSGDATGVSVNYDALHKEIKSKETIFVNDGKIKLRVQRVVDDNIHCIVEKGGEISSHKGINIPQTDLKISPLTDKDKRDVEEALRLGIDFVALSFVSSERDIESLRDIVKANRQETVQIIAKIERQRAIDRVVSIIDAADAIMVARGDLGVEIGVENVPKAQKMIIRESNKRLKPVIVATQMLESMIQSHIATRAEVSDVANAIYDRCDCVMLSGETAVGIDPQNVIETMRSICVASDQHMIQIKREDQPSRDIFIKRTTPISFCKAADKIAEENHAKAIMAFTSSGSTPLIASKLNPIFPIISPTDEGHICRRMAVYRGVVPLMMPKKFKDIHRWTDMIILAVEEATKQGMVEKGDVLVVTAGIPIGQSHGINSIRIITV